MLRTLKVLRVEFMSFMIKIMSFPLYTKEKVSKIGQKHAKDSFCLLTQGQISCHYEGMTDVSRQTLVRKPNEGVLYGRETSDW